MNQTLSKEPCMKLTLTLLTVLLLTSQNRTHAAEIKLASIFAPNAVLQRDMPVPVWGWAEPNTRVTVAFAGQKTDAPADADGKWKVTLNAMPANAAPASLTVSAPLAKPVSIPGLVVGDVWFCAGDAFMNKTIDATRSVHAELAGGALPPVRLFRVKPAAARQPQSDVKGSWTISDHKNAGDFPAMAYLFAREIQAKAGVPVGIIEATDPSPVSIQRGGKVTGSTVESWISEDALLAIPAAAPIFEFYKSSIELRDALAEYESALGDWKLKTGKAFGSELRELEKREPDVWYDYVAEMRKAGKPAPADPPRKPTEESLRMATTHAANLHNGMIAPLAGIAARGVALSIGMANAPRATQYRALLPALILNWRKAWGREDLPFLFLQQARAVHPNIDPRALCELREAQAAATSTPKTAMVRTIDLGGNIFPDDMRTLAQRMAAAARTVAYGEAAGAAGPAVETVHFEEGKAIVRFRAGTTALAIRGGNKLKGFALTERPNRWAYAEALIEGDKVIVSHPHLKAPVALRYDWVIEAGNEGNLTDASGLPALPYRSDAWPAFTDTPAALKPNATATILPADLYPVADPNLPRVLLIGDSIMNGYSPFVIEALRGKVNIVRLVAFGMIGGNDSSAAAFCEKLRDGDYALIHYNDGLHSLPPRITDAQFGVGLTAMLKHLKTVTPRVIWATTTPAPDRNNTLGPDSQNVAVITRNNMSQKIAADLGIPVNDLYDLVISDREKLQGFANLHFNPEGSKLMGEQIATRILEALIKK